MAMALVHDCTGCNICVKECSFLQKSGNPAELAKGFRDFDAFECTLCGLCTAVCPSGIDPAGFFLERRREVRLTLDSDNPKHSPLIGYERRGTSRLYTFYGLPEGCDTVFFPGCALPGSRPSTVFQVYESLRAEIPSLGVVLDCCLKPSHDLGREAQFNSGFQNLLMNLGSHGIRKILVACPNCKRMFTDYGGEIAVQTVYELLAERPGPIFDGPATEAVFHDPCVARYDKPVQDAARCLAKRAGLTVAEMTYSRDKTLCCGRGGGANFVDTEIIDRSVSSRVAETAGRPLITYCAACADTYSSKATAIHVLDLWTSPKEAIAGKIKASTAPLTYLNRILLKAKFRRTGTFAIIKEGGASPALPMSAPKLKAAALLLLVASLAIIARLTGAAQLLEPEVLRSLVQGHEYLGPLLFCALYMVTPVLFLPGLPMTIAAGILFGPVWGVVYAIIGATLGASASFLVARYLARDWVESKLAGLKWKNLDDMVSEQGWKIVAITRLVPLFPFNLLNYAYGLTKIPFLHYVTATFFCMLPACIAFIVFSSSLPQLLKGNISPSLVIGTLLIAFTMLIPVLYRRKNMLGQKERGRFR